MARLPNARISSNMATPITLPQWLSCYDKMVVFDLEFVGDINKPSECDLWEIGAHHLGSNDYFHIVVDPGIKYIPPPEEGCFDLTQQFLNLHAVPLAVGLQQFVQWANRYRLLISHNCFKSDLMVLRGAFVKCGIECPGWLFMDSLLILRRKLPSLENYKLGTIYKHCVGTPMMATHRAMPDTLALQQIILATSPPSEKVFAYPMQLTPLQNVRGIGHACEMDLVRKGIRSVESLIEKILCEKASMDLWQDIGLDNVVHKFLQCLQLPVQDINSVREDIVWRVNTHKTFQNE